MKLLSTSLYALLCVLTPTLSSAAAFVADYTVISDDITYDVRLDGTYVMDEIETLRIDTDRGVKQRSQVSLPYSTTLEQLDVLEAYTTTHEGIRLAVTDDQIVTQQSPQSSGAPMFDDGKVKVIIFPGVDVGSTISFHVRKAQKIALFPRQFSMLEVAWAAAPIQSERVTLKAPASMRLYVDARGMEGGRVDSVDGGEQRWRWTLSNAPALAPETASVSISDVSPHVAATTFASYEAAAAAYLDRASPQAAVTPAIQTLANGITVGFKDRRSQAEALYRWVSQNIRYVALFLNVGGIVPHSAQAIADARYGDCKDHTTLLEALLAAKGIKSYPVLINVDASYELPTVAVTPGFFNHAITYIPEFGSFVDSTSGLARFGELPVMEYGKSALVTNDGSGRARLISIPMTNPAADRVDIRTRLRVSEDGTISGESEVANVGTFDWLARQMFTTFPAGMEAQVVSQLLAMSGQGGSGSFSAPRLHDLTQPFDYTTEFKIPNFAQFPGPGAISIPNGFTSFSNISATIEMFGPERRSMPFAVVNRTTTETIQLTFPPHVTLTAIPRNVTVETSLASYSAVYEKVELGIRITRKLVVHAPRTVASVADYDALRSVALQIARDLRAQVLFEAS